MDGQIIPTIENTIGWLDDDVEIDFCVPSKNLKIFILISNGRFYNFTSHLVTPLATWPGSKWPIMIVGPSPVSCSSSSSSRSSSSSGIVVLLLANYF